jgi:hypothetical protein
MALKTLRYCGNTSLLEQRGVSRAIHTLNNPKNYTCLLEGLSAIHLAHQRGAQGLMWGARGPFPPAAAMVVAVVTPVVFVLRLLKNAIKTLKLGVCKLKFLFNIIYCKTYYISCAANCSVARALTSLVQWDPGILGIGGKPTSLGQEFSENSRGRIFYYVRDVGKKIMVVTLSNCRA